MTDFFVIVSEYASILLPSVPPLPSVFNHCLSQAAAHDFIATHWASSSVLPALSEARDKQEKECEEGQVHTSVPSAFPTGTQPRQIVWLIDRRTSSTPRPNRPFVPSARRTGRPQGPGDGRACCLLTTTRQHSVHPIHSTAVGAGASLVFFFSSLQLLSCCPCPCPCVLLV